MKQLSSFGLSLILLHSYFANAELGHDAQLMQRQGNFMQSSGVPKSLEVVQIKDRKWKPLSTNGDFFFDRSRLSTMSEFQLNALCGEGFRVAGKDELMTSFSALSISSLKKPDLLPRSSELQNDRAMHQYCSVANPSAQRPGVERPAQIVFMRDVRGDGQSLGLMPSSMPKNPNEMPRPQNNFCRLFCVSK